MCGIHLQWDVDNRLNAIPGCATVRSRPRHLRRLRLVDADACSTYRVAVLCCVTSATSDPSLCTVGHTSDACGRTGALLTGLWERCAGRPSRSPDASTPVGFEGGGPPEDPRPHNWCSLQSALVAGSGTNSVQAGYSGVQSSTWRRTTLPWSADPRRRFARTTTTPLFQHHPPRGTANEAVNSRQSSFCGLRCRHLEQTANWRRRFRFTVNFSSTVKTFFLFRQSYPDVVYWHHPISGLLQCVDTVGWVIWPVKTRPRYDL